MAASDGLFDFQRSAEVVNDRASGAADPRLREVMAVLVRHLHAAVKEIKPTHEEWLAAIGFLTDTGHMCNEWRQEFILLSDVLGISMLVDAINHPASAGHTPHTILGPFYVEGAPERTAGEDMCLDGKGATAIVTGKVTDAAGGAISGASLDVWQTNDDGFYDVQQPEGQPAFNLRGRYATAADGTFVIRTVKPRFYPIPDDGPVGKLLGALGRHPNRAAHLHFILRAPGYKDVITHIFPDDCQYLREDTVFGVKPELVVHFDEIADPQIARKFGVEAPLFHVNYDFVMEAV